MQPSDILIDRGLICSRHIFSILNNDGGIALLASLIYVGIHRQTFRKGSKQRNRAISGIPPEKNLLFPLSTIVAMNGLPMYYCCLTEEQDLKQDAGLQAP
jgi:hypothetical protein